MTRAHHKSEGLWTPSVSGTDYFSLVLPENMEELVKLITEEPSEDVEEKLKYK